MNLFQKKKLLQTQESNNTSIQSDTTLKNNRNLCYDHLESILNSDRSLSKGVILKLYVENFKRLNDIFGYHYCEELLDQIVIYLKEKTNCTVYRYIGVEFIIILDEYTQPKALELAEEILEQFDHVWKVGQTDCLCSAQIGLSSYPSHASCADEMLKCLDLALSKAVEMGPNQVVIYDSNLHNNFLRCQHIALYLKTAIEKKEIEVRYRPTYHIEKQQFTRAEYYMRIFIKGIGLIGSAEFLPIAEDSGQIREIQYFALDQVGACIAELLKEGKDFDSIALPISSILFLQEDFLDEVKRVIDRYQIPKGKLALEFQESGLTTSYLNINIMLQELSELGIELILNEFCNGYSSLSTVLDLPINTVKLDRMFIWQLETNKKSRHVIDALIQMAKDLELNLIAEGVETPNQVELLTESGCLYQQGFYYAPTMEFSSLKNILNTNLKESLSLLNEEKERVNQTSSKF